MESLFTRSRVRNCTRSRVIKFTRDKGQLQLEWSNAVRSELANVAAFDPRPNGQSSVNNVKWYHYYNQWRRFEPPQLVVTSQDVPSSLPAYIAVFRTEGEQGVDFRPHIFDASLMPLPRRQWEPVDSLPTRSW